MILILFVVNNMEAVATVQIASSWSQDTTDVVED